jgi:hypothetical protein
MNSKKFVAVVFEVYQNDEMTIFETIQAVMEEHDIEIDKVVEYLKEEKTLLNDLRAELEKTGMVKGGNKTIDIEELF